MGKVLRLDVDTDPTLPYSIPRDNPFLHENGTRPEIFALGVRNIWRCGVDSGNRKTGTLLALPSKSRAEHRNNHRQTDRQTDRHTDRQTESYRRPTDKHTFTNTRARALAMYTLSVSLIVTKSKKKKEKKRIIIIHYLVSFFIICNVHLN